LRFRPAAGLRVLFFQARGEAMAKDTYTALARKWRPQGFDEVVGQEHITRTLRNALSSGRIHHAYLFLGSRGIGKTTTARILAKALNCLSTDAPTPDPCGTCENCRAIAAGNSIDVIEIDGASNNGVEHAREIRENVRMVPTLGRYKVYIIDEVHQLSSGAFNALLKTLEEPPDYMVIVLLSRNPALVLPTIKSRCNQIRFYSAAAETLKNALVERFGASPEQAEFLAAYSEGRPGKAISILKNENFAPWRQKVVELAGKICSSDVRYALKLSEELLNIAEEIKDKNTPLRTVVKPVLDILVTWYRDLLDLSVRGESAQLINFDLRDTLMAFTGDAARISSAINALVWARRALDGNANVQLVSDVTLVRLTR